MRNRTRSLRPCPRALECPRSYPCTGCRGSTSVVVLVNSVFFKGFGDLPQKSKIAQKPIKSAPLNPNFSKFSKSPRFANKIIIIDTITCHCDRLDMSGMIHILLPFFVLRINIIVALSDGAECDDPTFDSAQALLLTIASFCEKIRACPRLLTCGRPRP